MTMPQHPGVAQGGSATPLAEHGVLGNVTRIVNRGMQVIQLFNAAHQAAQYAMQSALVTASMDRERTGLWGMSALALAILLWRHSRQAQSSPSDNQPQVAGALSSLVNADIVEEDAQSDEGIQTDVQSDCDLTDGNSDDESQSEHEPEVNVTAERVDVERPIHARGLNVATAPSGLTVPAVNNATVYGARDPSVPAQDANLDTHWTGIGNDVKAQPALSPFFTLAAAHEHSEPSIDAPESAKHDLQMYLKETTDAHLTHDQAPMNKRLRIECDVECSHA